MKLFKTLTIIFIVSFAVSLSFSQDNAGGAVVEKNTGTVPELQNNNGTGGSADNTGITGSEEKAPVKTADDVKKTGSESIIKSNNKSNNVRKQVKDSVKTEVSAEETVTPVNEGSNSGEDFLLFINEGNFKYKRIPDIKLIEKTPSMADQNTQSNSDASSDVNNMQNSGERAFFGLSKNAADIIAKGGILLLILVIFILYKVRSRGPGRRSPGGKGSKVMKSFRK